MMTPEELKKNEIHARADEFVDYVIEDLNLETDFSRGVDDYDSALKDYLSSPECDREAVYETHLDHTDPMDPGEVTMETTFSEIRGGLLTGDICAQEYCECLGIAPEHHDCLEFWIVSDWLAERLGQHNEPTGEILRINVWGRTQSGQCITADSVIKEICKGD